MTFREYVQQIVDTTPGAQACTIMGFDGIAIDTYQVTGDLDVATLLIEYTATLQQAWDAQTQAGVLNEMVFFGSQRIALVHRLTEEYFIAVILASDGLVGKARFLIRIAAPPLVKELS